MKETNPNPNSIIEELVRDICSVSVTAAPKSVVRRLVTEALTRVQAENEKEFRNKLLQARQHGYDPETITWLSAQFNRDINLDKDEI